jgi:hypothetical protein
VVALEQMIMSLAVLVPIVLLTGEPIRPRWILVVPALALQSCFCAGLAFIFARIGAKVPDVSQMLPFILRVWLYTSGVMFSIDQMTAKMNPWIGRHAAEHQPRGGVHVSLPRRTPAGHPECVAERMADRTGLDRGGARRRLRVLLEGRGAIRS